MGPHLRLSAATLLIAGLASLLFVAIATPGIALTSPLEGPITHIEPVTNLVVALPSQSSSSFSTAGASSSPLESSPLSAFRTLSSASTGARVFTGGETDEGAEYVDDTGIHRPYGDRILVSFTAYAETYELDLSADPSVFVGSPAVVVDGVPVTPRLSTFSGPLVAPHSAAGADAGTAGVMTSHEEGWAVVTLFPDGSIEASVRISGDTIVILPANQLERDASAREAAAAAALQQAEAAAAAISGSTGASESIGDLIEVGEVGGGPAHAGAEPFPPSAGPAPPVRPRAAHPAATPSVEPTGDASQAATTAAAASSGIPAAAASPARARSLASSRAARALRTASSAVAAAGAEMKRALRAGAASRAAGGGGAVAYRLSDIAPAEHEHSHSSSNRAKKAGTRAGHERAVRGAEHEHELDGGSDGDSETTGMSCGAVSPPMAEVTTGLHPRPRSRSSSLRATGLGWGGDPRSLHTFSYAAAAAAAGDLDDDNDDESDGFEELWNMDHSDSDADSDDADDGLDDDDDDDEGNDSAASRRTPNERSRPRSLTRRALALARGRRARTRSASTLQVNTLENYAARSNHKELAGIDLEGIFSSVESNERSDPTAYRDGREMYEEVDAYLVRSGRRPPKDGSTNTSLPTKGQIPLQGVLDIINGLSGALTRFMPGGGNGIPGAGGSSGGSTSDSASGNQGQGNPPEAQAHVLSSLANMAGMKSPAAAANAGGAPGVTGAGAGSMPAMAPPAIDGGRPGGHLFGKGIQLLNGNTNGLPVPAGAGAGAGGPTAMAMGKGAVGAAGGRPEKKGFLASRGKSSFAQDLLKQASKSRRPEKHMGWSPMSLRSDSEHDTQPFASSANAASGAGAGAGARQLLLTEWPDCYGDGSTAARRFHVGVAVDAGFYAAHGNSVTAVQAKVASVFAQSNAVFLPQVKLYLSVDTIDLRTSPGGSGMSWNAMGASQPGNGCLAPASLLDSFSTWRGTTRGSAQGAWMLLTDCHPPPGTVGYAFIGTSCLSRHSVGWSSLSTALWRTVAHEFGHILGATHGGNGGIMDSTSDGRLRDDSPVDSGNYAFDYAFTRPEICAHLSRAVIGQNVLYAGNARVPLDKCWSSMDISCGNGVVEAGEECDPPSECCTAQCKWVPGADCNTAGSSGPCCKNCRAQPATTSCDNGNGYCAAGGQCTASVCLNYQGLSPCPPEPDNPCLQRCKYKGVCTSLNDVTSAGRPLPFAVVHGTLCGPAGVNPSPTCRTTSLTSSTCAAPAPRWVTGPWGPCSSCGGGTQTRAVACLDMSVSPPEHAPAEVCAAAEPEPTRMQTCSGDCKAEWRVGQWGECAGACGEGLGRETRAVECIVRDSRRTGADSTGAVIVGDVTCLEAGLSPRPISSRICTLTKGCSYSWYSGPWGFCSAACATPGRRSRTVACVATGDETRTPQEATRCLGQVRPAREELCKLPDTCAFAWKLAAWGPCSAPCDAVPGSRTRTVTCVVLNASAAAAAGSPLPAVLPMAFPDAGTTPVAETNCDALARPAAFEQCSGAGACVNRWRVGEWGRCSAACGEGQSARTVDCVITGATTNLYPPPPAAPPGSGSSTGGGTDVPAPLPWAAADSAAACPSPAPPGTRKCAAEATCDGARWLRGAWSSCSTVCTGAAADGGSSDGTGVRARHVVCVRPTENSTSTAGADTDKATQQGGDSDVRSGSAADVGDNVCLNGGVSPKPIGVETCSTPWPCTFSWAAGKWGACTPLAPADAHQGPCFGKQTRPIHCVATDDPSASPLPVARCALLPVESAPVAARSCIVDSCADPGEPPANAASALGAGGAAVQALVVAGGTALLLLLLRGRGGRAAVEQGGMETLYVSYVVSE